MFQNNFHFPTKKFGDFANVSYLCKRKTGTMGFIFPAGECRARIAMETLAIFTKAKLFIN